MYIKKKNILFGVIGITIVFVLAIAIYFVVNTSITTKDKKTFYLLIPENSTFDSVADSLNRHTFIPMFAFRTIANLKKYEQIKTGRYKITNGMNVIQLVNNLRSGRQEPLKISFNNIRTKEQLCARFDEQLMLDSASLSNILNDKNFLQQHELTLETAVCLFIPNTYEVYWTISPFDLFKRMEKEYTHFWTEKRNEKAANTGLSKTEIITLASIVEGESNNRKENPIIAGLYLNRLHKKMPLQADPTVIFAVGDFSIRRVLNEHTKIDSPYNTYLYAGLPPGPIRIPFIESIDAVLNFEKNNYLYMCAKGLGTGEHYFATTYAEHLKNARKYRQDLNKSGIK